MNLVPIDSQFDILDKTANCVFSRESLGRLYNLLAKYAPNPIEFLKLVKIGSDYNTKINSSCISYDAAIFFKKHEIIDVSHLKDVGTIVFNYTPEIINDWCKRVTKGLIPSINVSGTEDIILTSALYLNLKWAQPPESSDSIQFTNNTGTKTVKCSRFVGKFSFKVEDNYLYHYKDYNNDFYATFKIPYISADVEFDDYNAEIYIPHFKIENCLNIAQFSGSELGLSGNVVIKQANSILVNGYGTIAASVSSAAVDKCAVMLKFKIKLDKPFQFAIYHRRTRKCIFDGYVVDPQI